MKIRLSIAAGSAVSTTFEHPGPVVRIGRDPACELALQGEASNSVSRQHAQIELSDDGATLTDLGSSNGTLLNGRLLQGAAPLRVGDQIQMGFTGATLSVLALDLAPEAAPKAARLPPAVLFGSVAAAALVVLLLVGAVWFVKRNPSADQPGPTNTLAVIPPPSDTGRSPPPIGAVPDTGKQPPPPPADTGKRQPKLTQLDPGAPSSEAKPVGKYVALQNWVSVLLRREGETSPWGVLQPEDPVLTAQTLVSLPGYRSLVVLDNGLELTLWGNLPDFSPVPPVLESVVMLNAPAQGTDLDLTLDRGRVVVANRTSPARPARVRLRFLREEWDLDLPNEASEAAVELWGDFGGAADPTRGAPRTVFGLFTNKGGVQVKTPRKSFKVGEHSCVTCSSDDFATLYPETLSQAPDWWVKPPDRKAVAKALRSLLDWSDLLGGSSLTPEQRKARAKDVEPAVARLKTQVEEVRDPDNQDVGILFLASLDQVEPLLGFLEGQQSQNVRGVTIFALQSWLSRGGQHARELADLLEHRAYAKDKAQLVVRLLHDLPAEALGNRATYADLVKQLGDEKSLVRNLSFMQLVQSGALGYLPPEAKKIMAGYDPFGEKEKRRPAVEKLQKLLDEGKLPVRPRR
jgi:hypothetical protein